MNRRFAQSVERRLKGALANAAARRLAFRRIQRCGSRPASDQYTIVGQDNYATAMVVPKFQIRFK